MRPITVSAVPSAASNPRYLRPGPRSSLPLLIKIFRLVLFNIYKILSLLLVPGTHILLPFNYMRPITDVMSNRHLLGASARVAHSFLHFFHAPGGRTSALRGLVHLGAAVGARSHADDGATAVAVTVGQAVGQTVEISAQIAKVAAQKAVKARHGREPEGHERIVG